MSCGDTQGQAISWMTLSDWAYQHGLAYSSSPYQNLTKTCWLLLVMQQQASGQERRYKSRSANRKKKRKIPQIDNSEGIQTKIISHRCGGTGVAVMMV